MLVDVLLYVHRNPRLIKAQDGHLDFHIAPELCSRGLIPRTCIYIYRSVAHTASFAALFNRMALLEAATIALQDMIVTLEAISISSNFTLSPCWHNSRFNHPLLLSNTLLPPSPNPTRPLRLIQQLCTLHLHPSLPTSWLVGSPLHTPNTAFRHLPPEGSMS